LECHATFNSSRSFYSLLTLLFVLAGVVLLLSILLKTRAGYGRRACRGAGHPFSLFPIIRPIARGACSPQLKCVVGGGLIAQQVDPPK
jgi:hypothetical protein